MKGSPARRTARLFLRPPEDADIDALHAIQRDPVAMRYTYCAPDRAATEWFVASHAARFDEDGYAPWTVVLCEDERDDRHHRIVGWGGLGKDPPEPHWGPEVSYFFDPSVWGRGLASELVVASLALAFEDLGLDLVGAFARPANAGSRRVLEKCGFERLDFVPGLERDRFEASRRAS